MDSIGEGGGNIENKMVKTKQKCDIEALEKEDVRVIRPYQKEMKALLEEKRIQVVTA